mmetsp:Transcript_1503/g.3330  ORF Transcript_1503/g.3330 Transcript_1503/m.3330 type:complete len:257 (-) Transcript_1503:182-952(-)
MLPAKLREAFLAFLRGVCQHSHLVLQHHSSNSSSNPALPQLQLQLHPLQLPRPSQQQHRLQVAPSSLLVAALVCQACHLGLDWAAVQLHPLPQPQPQHQLLLSLSRLHLPPPPQLQQLLHHVQGQALRCPLGACPVYQLAPQVWEVSPLLPQLQARPPLLGQQLHQVVLPQRVVPVHPHPCPLAPASCALLGPSPPPALWPPLPALPPAMTWWTCQRRRRCSASSAACRRSGSTSSAQPGVWVSDTTVRTSPSSCR